MSDWSVRQLIDEYRLEGQENTDPKSRGKADYSDALQGVLAAMLLDEPSPLSVKFQSSSHRGPGVRTTEEALGALLDSNYRGNFSPASPVSSLQFNSSGPSSSAGRGLVGAVTTDDVLSYLIGDLGASSGGHISRAPSVLGRQDTPTPSSGTKGDPVFAAASRLFDQSRYSLDADWKPGDARPLVHSVISEASPQRRDSESGLDRADFALLPPALGRKPLTPLGEKDKTKASTPPEPVPTHTLVERKKLKEPTEANHPLEIAPPMAAEDLPHVEIVRPVNKRMPKARAGKKAQKERKKEIETDEKREVRLQSEHIEVNEETQKPAEVEPEQNFEASKDRGQSNEVNQNIGVASPALSHLEPVSAAIVRPESIVLLDDSEFQVIDEPELVALAENGRRVVPKRRSADLTGSEQIKGVIKNPTKKNRKRAIKNNIASEDVAQPESILEPRSDAAIEESNMEKASESETADNKVQNPRESDSGARHLGGALQKLHTLAQKMIQKPPSPAAWITPRPADVRSKPMPDQKQNERSLLPSVQVELSVSGPVDSRVEPDSNITSSIVPFEEARAEAEAEAEAEALSSAGYEPPPGGGGDSQSGELEGNEPSPQESSQIGGEQQVIDPSARQRRRSIPKRAVKPAQASLEIVPVEQANTQIVPARRGGRQSYGIQVSTVRAAPTKAKSLRLESMQPGKLRRISICEEKGDAEVEAGKIVRTAQKRIRVPALRWWAGERIEYKSEDGTLGRTVATAVYRKEDDQATQPAQKSRLRRLKEPLALTAAPVTKENTSAEAPAAMDIRGDLAKCKLHVTLESATGENAFSSLKPRAVPVDGLNRKNVVIRRSDVPNGWDLYKKNEMCFSANVLLQNACFASILFRLPPSETNGVDSSKNTHMLVEFVSGATLLVLMSRESASTVEHGEIVGERKGVELSRAGAKVMIPPLYRYQFKNVSETEESLLITHVVSENKQSFLS